MGSLYHSGKIDLEENPNIVLAYSLCEATQCLRYSKALSTRSSRPPQVLRLSMGLQFFKVTGPSVTVRAASVMDTELYLKINLYSC